MSISPIAFEHIHKSYASKQVLNDICLHLEAGEIFGLIGVNGAGKTTLIKILLDLISADSGQAMMFGRSSTDIGSRHQLSYLPEKFQPSRYLRGREYLDLSLSYYGKSLDMERARAKAAALDLDPNVLDHRVSSYSKGMGQKLGLLGAFMVDAPLLVLDEPMSGLDPGARIRLKHQLLAEKKAGHSVFFSSHILSDIDEICDRIGVIHQGKLFFIGKPGDFKARYHSDSLEQSFLKAIESDVALAA